MYLFDYILIGSSEKEKNSSGSDRHHVSRETSIRLHYLAVIFLFSEIPKKMVRELSEKRSSTDDGKKEE